MFKINTYELVSLYQAWLQPVFFSGMRTSMLRNRMPQQKQLGQMMQVQLSLSRQLHPPSSNSHKKLWPLNPKQPFRKLLRQCWL